MMGLAPRVRRRALRWLTVLAALVMSQLLASASAGAPGTATKPIGPTYGEHGMALFGGDGGLYASHLPMFHAPHDYQVVLQLHVANPAIDATLRRRLNGKPALWTIAPEKFELDRLAPQASKPLKQFKADLVLGHFEHGGKTQYAAATVVVDKVLMFRPLSAAEKTSAGARYVQLGSGRQRFLVKEIDSRPDYDHIVAYNAAAASSTHAITIAKQGVQQPDDGVLAAALQAPRSAIRGTVYFSTEDLSGMTNTTAQRTVPPEYEGLWRRQGIWRSNGNSDTTTPVWWFQSSSFHVDLRIPVDRPAVADAAELARLPADQQAIFAKQSGFAGVTVVQANRAEWSPTIAFPAVSDEIDAATMIFRDADHIREDGLDHSYYEEWNREPSGSMHGVRLQALQGGALAYLLISDRWLAWAAGRPTDKFHPDKVSDASTSVFTVYHRDQQWTAVGSNLPWLEQTMIDAQLLALQRVLAWKNGDVIDLPMTPGVLWRVTL